MSSAIVVARTGGWVFAVGVGIAVASAGAGTASADASPNPGAPSGNSSTAHSPRAAKQPSAKRSVAPQAGVKPASSARITLIRTGKGFSARPAAPVVPSPVVDPGLVDALGAAQRDVEVGKMYGNPTLNSKYWVGQSSMNCVLMSTAMAIGQLTGKTPTEPQIVFEALNTESVSEPGRPMYLGLKSNIGITNLDALTLLKNHGIGSHEQGYPGQPDVALQVVKDALADPNKAVMVTVDAHYIWDRLEPQDQPPKELANQTDHMVVVIGVDTTTNTVYLNDPGMSSINPATKKPWGQNMAVPLNVFMPAWSAGSYNTTVATVTGDPKPIGPWVNIMPRRDFLESTVNSTVKMAELRKSDPDLAAHLLHYRR